jgi:DeoR family fructose operon transcriptional repressor
MIPAGRRARIVAILRDRGEVRVSSLSTNLGVSEMTIRRDLERLETEGVLMRTHGGGILKRHLVEEPLYVERAGEHPEEKERIAKAAAAMIRSGETVFLSNGTTAARVLRHVDPDLRARVVTYNVGALAEVYSLRLEIILLGGSYRPRTNTVEGPQTLENLERFHATKTLIGADGFDLEDGVTTPSLTMASIERAMIDNTRGEVIVLADRSKIGVVADVVICRVDKVDAVIVDDGVEAATRDEIKRAGLRCVVA